MNDCDRHEDKLAAMGPHKKGKSCFYLKNLQEIDLHILKVIIADSIALLKIKHS